MWKRERSGRQAVRGAAGTPDAGRAPLAALSDAATTLPSRWSQSLLATDPESGTGTGRRCRDTLRADGSTSACDGERGVPLRRPFGDSTVATVKGENTSCCRAYLRLPWANPARGGGCGDSRRVGNA
jgi:hypothetical protein